MLCGAPVCLGGIGDRRVVLVGKGLLPTEDEWCRVKGLQLKTGCPVEDYFKLWLQKLKL